MKQKLFIFLVLFLMIAVLAGLNAATYVQKQKEPDMESTPNRSTFNPGATGTQAFYTLLTETGRKAVRWQESPSALSTAKVKPSVFVIAGTIRRDITPVESDALLRWVAAGGRLVVIDRSPPKALLQTSALWKLNVSNKESFEILSADPSDQNQMTVDTAAVKPVQPSVFTTGVNAVQPSRFAADITFERIGIETKVDNIFDAPPPSRHGDDVVTPSDISPTVHIGSSGRNILVDAPYGDGRLVLLSEPYIVSNGGISLVDNAQLAINLVATDGIVAFDEYHQGYGSDNNRFLQFFAGTPIVAIFLQAVVLVGFIFYSQSRRFGRAVPEPEPDRLTKLEYVSAMAELQQRTRAFDLAIENIYNDFRRRVTRQLGLDNLTAKPHDIARSISERTGLDSAKVETTLFKCEEIVRGEPTNKREVLALTTELREIETKLGMRRGPVKKL